MRCSAAHYRQPINWTLKNLNEAEKTLASWFDAAADEAEPRPDPAVVEALADDLNTPKAIAEIHAHPQSRRPQGAGRHDGVSSVCAPMCLRDWQQQPRTRADDQRRRNCRAHRARLEARKAKNFAESDRIRDELAALGVVLKDSKEGTTWEIAR